MERRSMFALLILVRFNKSLTRFVINTNWLDWWALIMKHACHSKLSSRWPQQIQIVHLLYYASCATSKYFKWRESRLSAMSGIRTVSVALSARRNWRESSTFLFCYSKIYLQTWLANRVDTYNSHEGLIYCKPHFKQLFQPKAVLDTDEPCNS